VLLLPGSGCTAYNGMFRPQSNKAHLKLLTSLCGTGGCSTVAARRRRQQKRAELLRRLRGIRSGARAASGNALLRRALPAATRCP